MLEGSRQRLARIASAALFLVASSSGCSKSKAAAGFTPPPVAVEVAVAKKGTVAERLKSLGTVESDESVKVAVEIDALVRELPFQEGGLVKKGQVIALLNDTELAAEARRAEALRDQARLTFKRLEELTTQKVASPQDRDNAQAALNVAEANVNLAHARLSKTRVLAPFNGVTGRRLVSPGAFLKAGDVITDLARIDPVKLAFSVPERHLPAMKRGAKVTVTTVASPGKTFQGSVNVVEPMLDPTTRTARIVALVPNPAGELRPGMSAEVTATLEERANAVTIPDEAVFAEGDKNFVYTIKSDDTVSRVAVELGSRQPGSVEVTKGLSGGEKVVRAGHQKLYDGAKVSAVTPDAAGAPAAAPAGGAPP